MRKSTDQLNHISGTKMADSGKKLIVCTMKNEGPYLLEWLAYHRVIGFTDFLIYTNDCSDGSDLLLDRLHLNGEITHERTKVLKRGPQKSAYKAALQHPLYQSADWVLASDADEFLNIHIGAHKIDDLINQFPDADAIPVCWRLFSNNGKESLPEDFVISELIDAQDEDAAPKAVGRFVKSVFRPHPSIIRIGSHAPVYAEDFEAEVEWGCQWIDKEENPNPRRPSKEFGYEIAQMNHYAVRTIDAFLLKRDRGDVNFMKDRLEMEYWTRWCQGGNEDVSILKMLEPTRQEYERLIKDPVVKALHQASLEVHRNRLTELLEQNDVQKLKADILKASVPRTNDGQKRVFNIHSEELVLKAPRRHENRLRMLREMPKHGRCAEIGVWNGAFSLSILEVTEPSELTLIDPWEQLAEQNESEWTHKRHKDHQFMKGMREHVSNCYSALSNVKIRNGFSQEILPEFEDGYFDWVYVDGNHQYDFVRADLKLAFQKVRPGGIIAGDDFFWKLDGRMHVKEAVLDEMREQGMTNRPTRFGQQFIIHVPDLPR